MFIFRIFREVAPVIGGITMALVLVAAFFGGVMYAAFFAGLILGGVVSAYTYRSFYAKVARRTMVACGENYGSFIEAVKAAINERGFYLSFDQKSATAKLVPLEKKEKL